MKHVEPPNRRAFLSLAASLPCVQALLAVTPEWNYTDKGPQQWPRLDPQFGVCSAGDQQSPIDLHDAIKSQLPPVQIDWKTGEATVLNNGRTIQVNVPEGSTIQIGGVTSRLTQFHFHGPSEHAVNGKRFAMEAHFVHTQANGDITVLAVFLTPGGQNALFSTIMRAAPQKADGKSTTRGDIDPAALLPRSRQNTWRYHGSLTTPPCSQTVDWVLFEEPVSVAQADIDRFHAIFAMNARPVQPLNRRFVLRS